LPFCKLRLRGARPPDFPIAYAREPKSLGEHIRKERLQRGLRQRDVAAVLGVDQFTLINWETGKVAPAVRHIPAALRFLGFDPTPRGATFPERLKARRLALGLTQEALARMLDVNECTVQYLERGRRPGSRRLRARIEDWLRRQDDVIR
jgi:transcriptional regulator with XRE-family HTH domain